MKQMLRVLVGAVALFNLAFGFMFLILPARMAAVSFASRMI